MTMNEQLFCLKTGNTSLIKKFRPYNYGSDSPQRLKPGDCASMRFLFAFLPVRERYRDVAPIDTSIARWTADAILGACLTLKQQRHNWQFNDSPQTGVFTTERVTSGKDPITRVFH